jgi:3-phytase
LTVLGAAFALAGCMAGGVGSTPQPAAPVTASGETVPVGTSTEDAADDPAIWRNPADPQASLIVATDKRAGLYVYGLDGKVKDFQRDGALNNVDLVALADGKVLVAASDRNDRRAAKLRLYQLDTKAGRLMPIGTVPAGRGEAYGVCLWRDGSNVDAFSVLKDGTIVQLRLSPGPAVVAREVRRLKLASQSEGCVVDPRDRSLYVGEERAGVWRFSAAADAPATGTLVAAADGGQLVADVEGLALAPVAASGGWLIVSSQGDNAYALYSLPDFKPAGRFRIAAGRFGATEETDGIELALGDFGPDYPGGLFIAQDGMNAPAAQNYKLVAWSKVVQAVAAASAPGQ